MEQGQEHPAGSARRWLRWIVVGGLALLIVPSLLLAALQIGIHGNRLYESLTRETTIGLWHLMALFTIALCSTAILLAAIAIRSGRMLVALLSSTFWIPVFMVFGPHVCDTEYACPISIQRVLPPEAAFWSIRIRPVEDANEARRIASDAISTAGLNGSPFLVKHFGDHWLVSLINHDGEALAEAVRIDARSGFARIVLCPPDLIRCGMEWPTPSDGHSPYRNTNLGISAVFPEGLSVCTMRDEEDDRALGFVAEFRGSDEPCDAVTPDGRMGVVVGSVPRQGCLHPGAPELAWGPLTAETRAHFGPGQPAFSGEPFIVCELHAEAAPDIEIPAQMEIMVLITPEPGPTESQTRPMEAFLVTTPDDLARDARLFEAFLETLEIGSAPD